MASGEGAEPGDDDSDSDDATDAPTETPDEGSHASVQRLTDLAGDGSAAELSSFPET
ncbi:hypothetical protein [Halosimplex salinum]|uniref:hypothetical protein n=1 Tax=Halosimplex salinum TaxID=1710538 RepID=UPI0013DDE47E|nr:hypothetical protein [Halosimplex salinum]